MLFQFKMESNGLAHAGRPVVPGNRALGAHKGRPYHFTWDVGVI